MKTCPRAPLNPWYDLRPSSERYQEPAAEGGRASRRHAVLSPRPWPRRLLRRGLLTLRRPRSSRLRRRLLGHQPMCSQQRLEARNAREQ
jgi:hypothetical protein